MKNFTASLVILYVAVSSGTQLQLNSPLDHHVNTMVELWREGSISSCSPVAFPSMASIPIANHAGSFDQKGIKMSYGTGEMRVTGLENAVVNDITTSTTEGQNVAASLTFTIPALKLTSDSYWISGKAYHIYPISGSGKLTMMLYNVNIKTDMRLQPSGSGSKVTDAKIKYTVESVKADLQDSSWPINTVLNNEGAAILSFMHEDIASSVKKAIMSRADSFLETIPPAVLLKHITNAGLCKNLDKNKVKIVVTKPLATDPSEKSLTFSDVNAIVGPIVEAVKDLEDQINPVIHPVVNAAKDLGKKLNPIVEPVENAVKYVGDKLSPVVDIVEDAVKDAADKVSPVVDTVEDAVKDAADKVSPVVDSVVDAAKDLWKGIWKKSR